MYRFLAIATLLLISGACARNPSVSAEEHQQMARAEIRERLLALEGEA